jgi:hypothetical protein
MLYSANTQAFLSPSMVSETLWRVGATRAAPFRTAAWVAVTTRIVE